MISVSDVHFFLANLNRYNVSQLSCTHEHDSLCHSTPHKTISLRKTIEQAHSQLDFINIKQAVVHRLHLSASKFDIKIGFD